MVKPLIKWTDLAYTDGSKQEVNVEVNGQTRKKTILGSGVYLPPKPYQYEEYIELNPGGLDDSKTINRAELIPILHILQNNISNNIATDSMSAMCQIQK